MSTYQSNHHKVKHTKNKTKILIIFLGENNQVQADDEQMEQDGNETPITLTWEEYRRITNLCVHKLR